MTQPTTAPRPTPNEPEGSAPIRLFDPSQLATGAGLVTVVIGAGLVAKPEATNRLLGFSLPVLAARALGLSDLVVGPQLLRARRRAPWMVLRTVMNFVIAGQYHRQVREAGTTRARGGFALMSFLTVFDGAVAFALSRQERDA